MVKPKLKGLKQNFGHVLNFAKVALKQTLINKSPKDWNDYNNRKHHQQNREAVKLLTQI